jgi:carbamoyl-phosphate synthase large subunit
MALTYKIPYYTLLTAAAAGIKAIRSLRSRPIEVAPLQAFFEPAQADDQKEAV